MHNWLNFILSVVFSPGLWCAVCALKNFTFIIFVVLYTQLHKTQWINTKTTTTKKGDKNCLISFFLGGGALFVGTSFSLF